MPKNRKIKVVAGIVASFAGLAGTIVFLAEAKIIGFEMASLMLVALLAACSLAEDTTPPPGYMTPMPTATPLRPR